jgi:hypothetical protein
MTMPTMMSYANKSGDVDDHADGDDAGSDQQAGWHNLPEVKKIRLAAEIMNNLETLCMLSFD